MCGPRYSRGRKEREREEGAPKLGRKSRGSPRDISPSLVPASLPPFFPLPILFLSFFFRRTHLPFARLPPPNARRFRGRLLTRGLCIFNFPQPTGKSYSLSTIFRCSLLRFVAELLTARSWRKKHSYITFACATIGFPVSFNSGISKKAS